MFQKKPKLIRVRENLYKFDPELAEKLVEQMNTKVNTSTKPVEVKPATNPQQLNISHPLLRRMKNSLAKTHNLKIG